MKTAKQKLYCYVDETGQDTQGALFVVSVAVTKEDRQDGSEPEKSLKLLILKKY